MSMYLPNDEVRPTGDEAAEFIDTPVSAETDVSSEAAEVGEDQASSDVAEAGDAEAGDAEDRDQSSR